MARLGSLIWSAANFTSSALSASTSATMGAFTWLSNRCLRGWNHSRRLLRLMARRNAMPSGGKPGNADGVAMREYFRMAKTHESELKARWTAVDRYITD